MKYELWLVLQKTEEGRRRLKDEEIHTALLTEAETEAEAEENFEYCQELIFADPRYTPDGKT